MKKGYIEVVTPLLNSILEPKRLMSIVHVTVKTLSDKFSDEDMDELSKQNEDTQLKAYNFASEFCANSLKLN